MFISSHASQQKVPNWISEHLIWLVGSLCKIIQTIKFWNKFSFSRQGRVAIVLWIVRKIPLLREGSPQNENMALTSIFHFKNTQKEAENSVFGPKKRLFVWYKTNGKTPNLFSIFGGPLPKKKYFRVMLIIIKSWLTSELWHCRSYWASKGQG